MERCCPKPWPGTKPPHKILSHYLSTMNSSLLFPHTQRPQIDMAPVLVTLVLVISP